MEEGTAEDGRESLAVVIGWQQCLRDQHADPLLPRDLIMSEMDSAPGKPPPAGKRPRFAVSVRVVLLLILIVALWIAWKVHRAREQRLAVQVIREYGGWVLY